MIETQYLLLWLEAPLQAWGFDSKFSRRDTLDFPTKSGVLGLVCCALGAAGEQREFLSRMAPLKTTIIAFSRKADQEKGHFLRDFHMVGAGYNENDRFEDLLIPKKVDGKRPTGSGTKVTYRYYLQNRAFAAILQVPIDLSMQISNALQNPVWDLYLGRKSCPPSDIIFRGIYSYEEDAIPHALKIAEEKSLHECFKVIDGQHGGKGEVLVLNDIPVQFGQHKQYQQRYITVQRS